MTAPAAGVGGAAGGPCLGGAGRDAPGEASRSASVGRCGEGRAEAGAGWRAACAGTGWSVGAVTAAGGRAGGSGPDCSETLQDQVLLGLGDEGGGTAPSAVGDSWGCCGGGSLRPGAAAVGASGGCSG